MSPGAPAELGTVGKAPVGCENNRHKFLGGRQLPSHSTKGKSEPRCQGPHSEPHGYVSGGTGIQNHTAGTPKSWHGAANPRGSLGHAPSHTCRVLPGFYPFVHLYSCFQQLLVSVFVMTPVDASPIKETTPERERRERPAQGDWGAGADQVCGLSASIRCLRGSGGPASLSGIKKGKERGS